MRGLCTTEQSSAANPVLQLIARDGGFLADIISGTYKIEDISSVQGAPVEKVEQTAFTTNEKLGTGRYVIPTGSMANWKVGTHRAICEYIMVANGPTYTQVIEFEVLNAADWPTGAAYTGYVSSRRAIIDGYVDEGDHKTKVQMTINEASWNIEYWTGRFFEPRYLTLRVTGPGQPTLQLANPIIAIEDMWAIWQTTTGEDSYKYEQYLYKVYNRHLDGHTEQDDRKNPHVTLTDVDGTIVKTSTFAWPYGNQNIKVVGVFGYTDPDNNPNSTRIAVGHTPTDLGRAVGALVQRQIADPGMSNPLTWSPGSVRSMKTRHQSITFGGSGGGSAGGGGGATGGALSGDALVDRILAKYMRPMAFGAV